jgi:hypothetical protein
VNCELPVTGASISLLVVVGSLLVVIGLVSPLLVHRRGLCRVLGIVTTLVVGTTVLTLSGAQRADAVSCTSTAPSVAATAVTTTTTAADTPITGSIPTIVTSPGEALPEAPEVVALPAIGVLVLACYFVMRSRKNQAAAP